MEEVEYEISLYELADGNYGAEMRHGDELLYSATADTEEGALDALLALYNSRATMH